ncbi:hypothetical protein IU479_23625 [Nocardia abscessus]|uniref:hypothetical protein n=1 Tax=Nocardia abscessus TaxID=120957 RepID=UPI0018939DD9|nr:hypothetical protein [Nocardia abscessus]MBF6221096.1 hypothetical protein [Nocardia abscessus]
MLARASKESVEPYTKPEANFHRCECSTLIGIAVVSCSITGEPQLVERSLHIAVQHTLASQCSQVVYLAISIRPESEPARQISRQGLTELA